MITQVNCNICLKSADLHIKRVFVGFVSVVRWHFTINNRLNFDGLSGQENYGQHFPWIVPRLVTHMQPLHTCFAEISSFVFSDQPKIFCRSFEISSHRKIRVYVSYKFWKIKMVSVTESQITPKFPKLSSPLLSAHHLGFITIVIDYRIKCVHASYTTTAFSDTDVMFQLCLPYIQAVAVVWFPSTVNSMHKSIRLYQVCSILNKSC